MCAVQKATIGVKSAILKLMELLKNLESVRNSSKISRPELEYSGKIAHSRTNSAYVAARPVRAVLRV